MKILLVGGTGVLSSAILIESLSRGYEIYLINRGNKKHLIPDNVVLLQANIKNESLVKKLIGNIFFDVVVDFRCFTEEDIRNSFSLFKHVCKQFIFISTGAVYKITDDSRKYKEDDPLINPLWDYSINKVKSEVLFKTLCEENNLIYTIIRPGVTYGNTRIPYGIMPSYGKHWTLIARILNDKPILLWDSGKNTSSITRVEDFAIGAVGLFGNSRAFNQAFNIVGDESYKWIDIINTIGEIIEKKPILVDVPKEFFAKEMPSKKGEIIGGRGTNQVFDNTKIIKVVPDFKTTLSLKEGIIKTLNHYKSQNYLDGIDYAFDGDIDRIIYKYNKANKIPVKNLNLNFIDYLNEKKLQNSWLYFLNYHKNNLFVMGIILGFRVFRKIIRISCKMLF